MATDLNINVSALDDPHRRALEEVMGCQLNSHQRLVISVTEADTSTAGSGVQSQSLSDWTKIYAGLNEAEVASMDETIKVRANMTREPS